MGLGTSDKRNGLEAGRLDSAVLDVLTLQLHRGKL